MEDMNDVYNVSNNNNHNNTNSNINTPYNNTRNYIQNDSNSNSNNDVNDVQNNTNKDNNEENTKVVVQKRETHKPTTWRGKIKRVLRGSAYVVLRLVIFQFENVISVDTLEDWFTKYERVEYFCGPPIPKEKLDALHKKDERTQKFGVDRGRRLRSYARAFQAKRHHNSGHCIDKGYASDSVLGSNERDSHHYFSDNENRTHNFHGTFPNPDTVEGHNFKEKRMPNDKDISRLNHMIDDKNRPLRRRGHNNTVQFGSFSQSNSSHTNSQGTEEIRTEDSMYKLTNHDGDCIPITHPSLPFHLPFLVIDARRVDEYIESHIHGSVNIPYLLWDDSKAVIEALPEHIDKKTTIITYCAVGLRSGLLQMRLKKMGFVDVRTLAGGYYKWVNEGRPIYVGGDLVSSVMPQHILAAMLLERQYNSKKVAQVNGRGKRRSKGIDNQQITQTTQSTQNSENSQNAQSTQNTQ
eukprot:TRINITY_DN1828_c0_g2_i1.p1 TRINITY_DN1828_c0_g2~~TRINITY_DN1828_c0_g2_i1.p1  ORF type:complete len:465 (-),score=89.47 TRINITY_DN1828_c0_g2_i1:85-1479(-)